jgi:hypothetical protein
MPAVRSGGAVARAMVVVEDVADSVLDAMRGVPDHVPHTG